jgi:CheY-like chemotaxis protein
VVLGTATSGEEAIQLCRELQPDVLVVDHRMPPGLSGLDVLHELRREEGLRRILYTNYSDRQLRRDAERLGATFLLKGNLGALRAAVIGENPAATPEARGT